MSFEKGNVQPTFICGEIMFKKLFPLFVLIPLQLKGH